DHAEQEADDEEERRRAEGAVEPETEEREHDRGDDDLEPVDDTFATDLVVACALRRHEHAVQYSTQPGFHPRFLPWTDATLHPIAGERAHKLADPADGCQLERPLLCGIRGSF